MHNQTMSTADNHRKKRRLTAAVIDYDTREVMEGLAPPITYSATKKGAFMEYFKLNEDRMHELTTERTPSAMRIFMTLATHATQGNAQHALPTFAGTQTALAHFARTNQPTTSRALKELQAADLVRLQVINGLPVYTLSPFHVWKGANALHRKAQIEWQRATLKEISA